MKTALGIDVGGTKIRAGLIDEEGTVRKIIETKTDSSQGRERVVRQMLSLVESFPKEELSGIGIGTAGQVGLNGSILSATETISGWAGIHLQEIMRDETGLPVRVVNDVQAMALGELYFGGGKGLQDFLCLALGTGVGGAIVADGRLYRGASGAAGEMGHLTLHPQGRKCPCGRRGCLEAYVSGTALANRYLEKTGTSKKTSAIIGDSLSENGIDSWLMTEFLDDLIMGIVSLTTIFNPQKMILGGGLAEGLSSFLTEIAERVRQELSPASALPFSLSISELGGSAMILGAASLILKGGTRV